MPFCWNGAGYGGALDVNSLESPDRVWGRELQLKIKYAVGDVTFHRNGTVPTPLLYFVSLK